MTVTLPTIGQDPWGGALNGALAKIMAGPLPDDRGMLGWAFPPFAAVQQNAIATGVLHLSRIDVHTATTISNIVTSIAVAGVTLTAGQNYLGLYNSSGVLVAQTVDQTAAWGSAGNKTTAITPYVAAAGFYWVAHLSNGTTAPQFLRTFNNPSGLNNVGSVTATSFSATSGAALTALPASFTPGAITPNVVTYWAGIS
jgi:molybdopterin-binding protein